MKMDYIKIAPNQEIELEAKEGVPIDLAIAEAIGFVKDNGLSGADLFTSEGYLFGIDADSDTDGLMEDYREYLEITEEDE